MHVLLGECTGRRVPRMMELGWGRMWIARGRNIYTYPGEPWGLDNGAFRDYREGKPFDDDAFLQSVDKALEQETPPIMAVLPDSVGDAEATLDMSLSWIERLPRSLPWYYVLQDGVTEDHVRQVRPYISGLFLGGTSRFKSQADVWRPYCRANGIKFHYGRCGTINKLAHAKHVKADSIDSAFPMWTDDRWNYFEQCVLGSVPQMDLLWSCVTGTDPLISG